jgi:hypothetical protein
MRKHTGETGFLGLPMEPYRCIFFWIFKQPNQKWIIPGATALINHHLSSRMVATEFTQKPIWLGETSGEKSASKSTDYSSVFLLQSRFFVNIPHFQTHPDLMIIVFVTYFHYITIFVA